MRKRTDIISQTARACNVTPRHLLYLACMYNDMSQEDFEKIVSDYNMKRKLPYAIRSYALDVLKAHTHTA